MRLKKDKASIIPIEETYTNNDININDTNVAAIGYRFDSPRRWCTAASNNKSIGIRDLNLTPSSGDIRCRFITYGRITVNSDYYEWNSESDTPHYDYYDNDDDDPDYGTITYELAKFRSISDNYNIQITPQNNFEEIITSLVNFINGPSWKQLNVASDENYSYRLYTEKKHINDASIFYCKPEDTTETVGSGNNATEEPYTDYSSVGYIMNINYLKIPINFFYQYNADVATFSMKNMDEPVYVTMTNHSKSNNNLTINTFNYNKITFGSTITLYSDRLILDSEDVIENKLYLRGYDPNFDIQASELLMIIKKSDVSSIQAVYDFFNQQMPDINTLPTITIENVEYVVPFVNNSHYNMTIYNDMEDEIKHKVADDTPGFITNLNLNNVWDRIHLIYHASFAETRHRIIGRNGDHWDTPNKQFIVPGGDQDQFYIRFTTNGTHYILPIGCKFNIDLCFMLNPTKNTATGVYRSNQDSFKD